MKKVTPLYTLLFSLIGLTSFGQNTFPATGNVGIGTLTPGFSLDVAGSINATQVFMNGSAMESSPWTTAGNTIFYNTGNVGVGTNTPGYLFDVAGTLNATSILINGSPIEAPLWDLNGNDAFYNTGDVGIGTNTPGYTLDVNGTINATDILINGGALPSSPWSLNGNDAFYNTGDVGIGTNTPGFTLDVNGTVNATDILINGAALPSSPWAVAGNDVSYTTGNVGIGTTDTQGYLLAVAGNMIAEGLKVELQTNWPDFVFESNFDLPSLQFVEQHIFSFGHLPNIPSAKEVGENGIDVGQMNAKLLQKIEELTLYTIQQQKELDSLKVLNARLTKQNRHIQQLAKRLEKLENLDN